MIRETMDAPSKVIFLADAQRLFLASK